MDTQWIMVIGMFVSSVRSRTMAVFLRGTVFQYLRQSFGHSGSDVIDRLRSWEGCRGKDTDLICLSIIQWLWQVEYFENIFDGILFIEAQSWWFKVSTGSSISLNFLCLKHEIGGKEGVKENFQMHLGQLWKIKYCFDHMYLFCYDNTSK